MKTKLFSDPSISSTEQIKIIEADLAKLNMMSGNKLEHIHKMELDEYGITDQLEMNSDAELENFIERVENKIFPTYLHRNAHHLVKTATDVVNQSIQEFTELEKKQGRIQSGLGNTIRSYEDFTLEDPKNNPWSKDKEVTPNIDSESTEIVFPTPNDNMSLELKNVKNVFNAKKTLDSIDRKYFNYKKPRDSFDVGLINTGVEYYQPKKSELDLNDEQGNASNDFNL
jgi:hypothetical protein